MPYSEKFIRCIDKLLDNEGGYVNLPSDPGGETKFGISKRSYPHLNIKELTREQAVGIYWTDFWQEAGCEVYHEANCFDMLDAAVNHGIPRAKKLLQQALGVVPDGVIGRFTRKAMETVGHNDIILRFNAYRIKYFITLKGFRDGTFSVGWMDRVANNMIYASNYN